MEVNGFQESRVEEASLEEITKPVDQLPESQQSVEEILHSETPQFIAACGQSVGMQRDHNEDAIFCLSSSLASNARTIPFGLYIIADGMGGYQHGEIASSIAIRSMAEHVISQIYTPLVSLSSQPLEDSLQDILKSGIKIAHQNIRNKVTEGGTTLTTVIILGDQMLIAHIGDCRVYTIEPNGDMSVLTRDHSLVERLVELGQLTPEEAATHPQRNVLYRAIGQGDLSEPEIISAPLAKPGYLLLCSDGLWGVVSEAQISRIITSWTNPHKACQKLIAAANEAGGPDNITSILVQLP